MSTGIPTFTIVFPRDKKSWARPPNRNAKGAQPATLHSPRYLYYHARNKSTVIVLGVPAFAPKIKIKLSSRRQGGTKIAPA